MKKLLLTFSILILCFILFSIYSISFASTEEVDAAIEIEEVQNENEEELSKEEEEKVPQEAEIEEEQEENNTEENVTEGEEVNKEDVEQEEIDEEEKQEEKAEEIESDYISNEVGILYGQTDENPQTISDGRYKIVSALDNNKVIDISDGSLDNGANVHLWDFKNLDNQKYKLSYIDGYYTIESIKSGKVLDVSGAGQANGTNVIQWKANGTDAQKWIIQDAGNGYYYIISKCNDLYLDIAGGSLANGTNIQMFRGNGTAAQKFKFILLASENGIQTIEDGNYQIVSALNGNKVLDIEAPYNVSGANLHIYDNKKQNNQVFKVFYNGDGTYTIGIFEANNVLDVSGAGKSNGTNVGQWKSNNTDAQKWVIKDAGNDYYYIISRCNDLYLDIAGASTLNGTNVQVFTGNGTLAQKFSFVKYIPAELTQTIADGTYVIASALNNNKIIEIGEHNKSAGINVQLGTNNNLNTQIFTITYLEDGYYEIENAFSNKVLDVANGSTKKGANIWQWTSNDTDAQKWIIKDAGYGYYYIVSKLSGYTLDIASGSMADGANIQVFSENGTAAQKFRFIPTQIHSTFYGIDVSEWNGNIDWNAVSQIEDFAIIRVGYRGYRNPRLVVDSKFYQNMQGALNSGMQVGAYFFTTAINETEAIEEANWTANMLSSYNITYPVAVDVEWTNGNHDGRSDYLSVSERTAIVKAYCETIKARGYTPMIYASMNWLYYYLDMSQLTEYDVWLAHYTSEGLNTPSSYTGSYTTWQYSSKGILPGINGYVDVNICYKQY